MTLQETQIDPSDAAGFVRFVRRHIMPGDFERYVRVLSRLAEIGSTAPTPLGVCDGCRRLAEVGTETRLNCLGLPVEVVS